MIFYTSRRNGSLLIGCEIVPCHSIEREAVDELSGTALGAHGCGGLTHAGQSGRYGNTYPHRHQSGEAASRSR